MKAAFTPAAVGDFVSPRPNWNCTERPHRHLAASTKVLGVTRAQSQTGVLYLVEHSGGDRSWLDAAWFEEPK